MTNNQKKQRGEMSKKKSEDYKLGYFNALKWVVKQLANQDCGSLYYICWLLEREIHKRKIINKGRQ